MHRRLSAPFGGQAAHGNVGLLLEAEELTDHSSVQKSTVGVGVRDVGGLQLHVPEFVENGLRGPQLLLFEGAEVKDGQ